jgi:predicted aconitase
VLPGFDALRDNDPQCALVENAISISLVLSESRGDSMYLDKNEEMMLKGEYGPAVEIAMNAVVKVGDALDARKLVPVVRSHLVNAGISQKMDGYWGVVEELWKHGGRVQVPTSENPYAWDVERAAEFGIGRPDVFEPPGSRERMYREMGVLPTWTCTPYLYGNVPMFGQHVAMEESSNVIYANSVLGARTNRTPVLMDIASAVVGRTPYYGLHLDENRRGEILYAVKDRRLKAEDYPAIGILVGKTAGTRNPVIDGFRGDVSSDDLKNFGAACATSGAVALYHIPGVTPEARDLDDAFKDGKPIDRIEVTRREIDEVKDDMSSLSNGKSVKVVCVGCPHYSFAEVARVGQLLQGKAVKRGVQFWICTHPGARTLAKASGLYGNIEASGARLTIACPSNLWTALGGNDGKLPMMTDSAKTAYHRAALTDVAYGSVEECVQSAVEGRVVRLRGG